MGRCELLQDFASSLKKYHIGILIRELGRRDAFIETILGL